MMKLALFLATEKGYTCLESLIASGRAANIGFVVSFSEENVIHTWNEDIKALCVSNNIKYFDWRNVKDSLCIVITENNITSAIAVSWRYMLPLDINNFLRVSLIVFHASLLPRYRGFAPTPTAIINGENVIGVTALFAASGVDDGDIILQREIKISHDKYMHEIISEQSGIYENMLLEIISMIEAGLVQSVKQDSMLASYSIWRGYDDYKINWGDSAEYIYNFIRALGEPYLGAFCFYSGKKIIIDRSEVIPDKKFEIRQPGKIWSIRDNMPEVICGSGMLRILQAHYDDDGELVKFTRLRMRL